MNPFREIAKSLRDMGVDQGVIHDVFRKVHVDMGDTLDEYISDDLLDALDHITGYCPPHLKLFPDGKDWKELENQKD